MSVYPFCQFIYRIVQIHVPIPYHDYDTTMVSSMESIKTPVFEFLPKDVQYHTLDEPKKYFDVHYLDAYLCEPLLLRLLRPPLNFSPFSELSLMVPNKVQKDIKLSHNVILR